MHKMRTFLAPMLVFAMLFTFLPLAVAEEGVVNPEAMGTTDLEALLLEMDTDALVEDLLTSPELGQLALRAAMGEAFSLQLQAELTEGEFSHGTASLMIADNQQDLLALLAAYGQLQKGADIVDVTADVNMEDLFTRLQLNGQDVEALTQEELELLYEEYVLPFNVEEALATGAYQVRIALMDVTNAASPLMILAKTLEFGTEGTAEVPAVLTDIEGHWAKAEILEAFEKGLIMGYQDKTFKPNQEITRVEFFVLAARAFGLESGEENLPFTDAGLIYNDYKAAVSAAVDAGILDGYDNGDGTFSLKPEQKITRDEMATFVAKALGLELSDATLTFADASEIADWAAPYVATAAEKGIVNGHANNTFEPRGITTRAQAAVLFLNVLNYLEQQ
ncbi:S-layer homology domain-containing protein [Heliorestis convoluta]|uniref:SLH domain-containing protein n=1 Tax=Heliorestis convoluta TaxID=356322 RepID=A0A5Q2N528_9FIRM|nr:S-layer homology domain-containing protein [Heliorestis convoluta]QGG48412.1 hypothetical protein FTV88_2314 [Heliorestis convoluta]